MSMLAKYHDPAPLVKPSPLPLPLPLPGARIPITIRVALPGEADFKFIDMLQKKHAKAVSFWPRQQLENHVKAGHVLIAEESDNEPPCPGASESGAGDDGSIGVEDRAHNPLPDGRGSSSRAVGYIIGRDKYFKREDVGIIYQLNVLPGKQRNLIGAALVQAMFDRAAYGCKLFCCWCAQDLPANHFWESIGFVPLAFRTGSERKQRIHIFWQKRIREQENRRATGGTPVPPTTVPPTPWWFPSFTSGGAIREGRLAIPIPPGSHWSDAKPMVIPGVPEFQTSEVTGQKSQTSLSSLTSDLCSLTSSEARARSRDRSRRRSAKLELTEEQKKISQRGGLWFAPAPRSAPAPGNDDRDEARPKRPARPRRQYHPKYVEAARELCARYLEEVQAGRFLPDAMVEGKYDVCRSLPLPPEYQQRDRVQIGRADSVRRLLTAA